MSIPREIIDEIRNRTSIAEVIGKYVQLTRSGTSLKGLCPFHGEKTPSFNVNEQRNIFHCFGCQEGGDVFKFVMKMENRAFLEVVEDLGERVGVEIPKRQLTPQEVQAKSENEEMLDANEKAKGFCRNALASQAGKETREYFKKRGLSQEVIEEFGLGFCGPGWDALARWWTSQKMDPRIGEKAGLLVRKSNWYDRFHDRCVFPVTNYRGRVIGFGGRKMEGAKTLSGDAPKYLNSSESPVYKKSDALYGLDSARVAIGKTDRVIVVEGYFDVLGLAQNGIREVIATCGTALTPQHLQILRRYAKKIVFLYDGDEAGQKAAVRALPLLLEAGIAGLYCAVPMGDDPDTWVQKKGRDHVLSELDGAIPIVDFWLRRQAAKAANVTDNERRELLKQLAPVFYNVRDAVLQDEYAAKLAQALGIRNLQLVVDAIARKTLDAPRPAEKTQENKTFRPSRPPWRDRNGRPWREEPKGPPSADLPLKTKLEVSSRDDRNLEETLLRLMLGSHRVSDTVRAQKITRFVKDRTLRSLGEKLAEAVVCSQQPIRDDAADQPDVAAVLDGLPDLPDAEHRLITRVAVAPLQADAETSWKEFEDVVLRLERRELTERKKKLKNEIAAAERSKDSERLPVLLAEARDVDRALAKSKTT